MRNAKAKLLATAVAKRPLTKAAFERIEPVLRADLLAAQYAARDARVPVIVLLAGSSRDAVIDVAGRLAEWLDARLIDFASRVTTSEKERARPWFWRYWIRQPQKGRMGVFPFGWAQDALLARMLPKLGRRERVPSLRDIAEFERTLAADGALLVKLWFHLDDVELAEQRRKESNDPLAPWDPDKRASRLWRRLEHHDRDEEAVLRGTHSRVALWHVVDASDRQARDVAVGRILRASIQERLSAIAESARTSKAKAAKAPRKGGAPLPVRHGRDRIGPLTPPPALGDEAWAERLNTAQGELNALAKKAFRRGVATVLVFEGPDAAGKGGAIRRITRAIRAPVYRVIPIAAPDELERSHHYLWRFWRDVPRAGSIAIFDRSWYGRVLVERVEGFAQESEWRRAYQEIADFERQLTDSGAVVIKFWIEVSESVQLARFETRGHVPFKKYKLTPDDFRNRAKRPAYRLAANEMFARTGVASAPWHLVHGDDKRAARAIVVETICRRLRAALRAARHR